MNVYYANPAVEFDWPEPAESDAPLVARVHDDPPATVPIELPVEVETVGDALSGLPRDELAARLAERAGLEPDAAVDRIDALVEAGVLVPDGPTRRRGRRWLDHGWRRSLYFHLETRDWAPPSWERPDEPVPSGPADEGMASPDDGGTAPSEDDGTAPPAGGGTVPLPPPGDLPDRPLDEVLLDRRTCRAFDGTPMPARDLSTLLDAALRPVRAARRRGAAPVGTRFLETGWFPFAVRPVVARSPGLDPGTYRYLVDDHALRPVEADVDPTPTGVDRAVRESVVNQPFVEGGAVTLLLSADLAAYRRGRPEPGALRHVFTAVSGHLHRFIVAATAMGYGCFQSAAFDDSRIAALAGTDGLDEPVAYLLTVGTEAV